MSQANPQGNKGIKPVAERKPSAFRDHIQLSADQDFQSRLSVALATVSRNVLTENVETAQHDARVRLAVMILAHPASHVSNFIWSVIGDRKIQAAGVDATDEEIVVAVDAVFNNFLALAPPTSPVVAQTLAPSITPAPGQAIISSVEQIAPASSAQATTAAQPSSATSSTQTAGNKPSK